MPKWNILVRFGKFMAIWYILCPFGTFFRFLYHVPGKIWQPWSKSQKLKIQLLSSHLGIISANVALKRQKQNIFGNPLFDEE
jgi:hypothetical protein